MGNIFGKIKYNKTIFELKIGESGYTFPDSLEITYNKNYYLNLERISKEKINNESGLEMMVTRIGPDKNDFDIDTSKVKYYKWLKTSEPFFYNIRQIEDPVENILIAKLNYNKDNPKYLEDPIPKKHIYLLKELNIKLNTAIKNEKFKIAAKLKNKIDKINSKE